MICHKEGASGAGSRTEDEIMSASREQGALGPEKSERFHKRPFEAFAPGDTARRKHLVVLPMDVILAVFRERLEYYTSASDPDAATQNAGCDLEKAMGIYPNLDGRAASAPASGAEGMTAGEDGWSFDRTRTYLLSELDRLRADLDTVGQDLTDDQGKANSWLDVAYGRAANIRSVLSSTPAPDTPPGVPDSVRALLDAGRVLLAAEQAEADAEAHVQRATSEAEEAVKAGTLKNFVAMRVASDIRMKALRQRQAAQDAVRKALGDALIAAHPAGQSAGSGAEAHAEFWSGKPPVPWGELDPDERARWDRHAIEISAPDSTRTGDEGTEEVAGLMSQVSTDHIAAFDDIAQSLTNLYAPSGPPALRQGILAALLRVHVAARPAAPEAQGAETFPKPRRKDGEPPCGECHLRPGETCDICGAVAPPSSGQGGR